MKKLMIAAAIVCAAAFAQAANYNWGNGSYSIDNWNGNQPMNPDLEAPMFDSGKMLLYVGTVSYTDGVGFDMGTAEFITSGVYDSENYVYGTVSYVQSDKVVAAGGQAYTLILLDNASYNDLSSIKDGDHFVLRNLTSEAAYDPDLSVMTASLVDNTAIGASDWTTYNSAPEPTSGLLLLLGVAGLALRRRHA